MSELERVIDLLEYRIEKMEAGWVMDDIELDDLKVIIRCLKAYNSL